MGVRQTGRSTEVEGGRRPTALGTRPLHVASKQLGRSLWVRGSFWEAGKEALLSQTTTYTPLMGWLENVVEHRPWLPGSLAHGAERPRGHSLWPFGMRSRWQKRPTGLLDPA